jgi:hypothetical protein
LAAAKNTLIRPGRGIDECRRLILASARIGEPPRRETIEANKQKSAGLKRRQTADAGADYDRPLLAARALGDWYDEVTVLDNYERQTGLQK